MSSQEDLKDLMIQLHNERLESEKAIISSNEKKSQECEKKSQEYARQAIELQKNTQEMERDRISRDADRLEREKDRLQREEANKLLAKRNEDIESLIQLLNNLFIENSLVEKIVSLIHLITKLFIDDKYLENKMDTQYELIRNIFTILNKISLILQIQISEVMKNSTLNDKSKSDMNRLFELIEKSLQKDNKTVTTEIYARNDIDIRDITGGNKDG